jgi:hypothetical protein
VRAFARRNEPQKVSALIAILQWLILDAEFVS